MMPSTRRLSSVRWLESVRAAIYGGDPKAELDKHNGAINTTLQGGG
jgi:hypothetical protein